MWTHYATPVKLCYWSHLLVMVANLFGIALRGRQANLDL